MYPFIRMTKAVLVSRALPRLGLFGTHLSHHICWPWDLDFWRELNNGRTLSLYDMGRVSLAIRTGLRAELAARGWGIAIAGASVRYRRRVRVFERVEMRTRCIGWDARFFYMEQTMWKGADCASHLLIRGAITSATGIVPPPGVFAALGHPGESPALPGWVGAWIAAEGARPWPPAL